MVPLPFPYYSRQFGSTAHQRRPRSIQQLISNHHHAPIVHSRQVAPRRITQGRIDLRSVSSRSPRQYNDVGFRSCNLRVAHPRASLNRHSAARNFYELRNPGRGTNPRIRPSLAVNPRPRALTETPRPPRHAIERPTQPSYQPLRTSPTTHQPPKRLHIVLDIRQRPRIDSQKRDGLLKYFRHGFRREGHRTDQQSWPQLHHFPNIQLPAIAHRGPRPHIGHVLAPAAHADKLTPRPKLEQNRSHTRRKRNDSHPVGSLARHDENNSTSAYCESRNAAPKEKRAGEQHSPARQI
jgi:hypothetical protein